MVNIPTEVIRKGAVTIYLDTDNRMEKNVNEYNDYMFDCRLKMKKVEETELAYDALNPLIVSAIFATSADRVLNNPVLGILILTFNALMFIVFAILKKRFGISTISSAFLLILDFRFAILIVANIILYIYHEYTERALREEVGYPSFNDIKISYERTNMPVKYVDFRDRW